MTTGCNVLVGGAGDDVLRGGAEVNVANGANAPAVPGGDHLVGGPGADMLDGGSSLAEGAGTPKMIRTDDVQHIDWAVYKFAKEGVMVDLSTNRGTGWRGYGRYLGQHRVDLGLRIMPIPTLLAPEAT